MLYRDFSTQADLDAVYDVEAAVPDFQGYLDQFEQANLRTRSELEYKPDVPFGLGIDERLDLFPAAPMSGRPPIVIFVHGGYWRLSQGRDYDFVARGLHRHAAVNVVNYSLAPKVPIWEIVRQVRAAIAWSWHNADKVGGDRDRIYVIGHSAGAHLTVMAALTDWTREYGLPADLVKGAYAMSGLYDLRPLPYTFIGPALQLSTREIFDLSPMLRDLPAEAPQLRIAYGDAETSEFIRQSDDFLLRWQQAGLHGDLSLRNARDHFSIMLDLADPESDLVRDISAFLKS